MDFSRMSLLIAAGGQSRRMGRDKRWLSWQGRSMVGGLLEKAVQQGFQDIFLCIDTPSKQWHELAGSYGARLVPDEQICCGPMEGLRRGLSMLRTEYALAISCDLPFFDFLPYKDLAEPAPGVMALVPVTDGQKQPLAAVYAREMAGAFETALRHGERRLGRVLEPGRTVFVDFSAWRMGFFNVNTPAELRLAQGRQLNLSRRMPVVSVAAACSGTGKTTWLERVLQELAHRNYRVGVVKSTHHVPSPDETGKDSQRFRLAGAQCTALVSHGPMDQSERLLAAAEQMTEVDLVLLESRSHGVMPVLELLRTGVSERLFMPENRLTAVLSDGPPVSAAGLPVFSLNDPVKAAELVHFLAGKDAILQKKDFAHGARTI